MENTSFSTIQHQFWSKPIATVLQSLKSTKAGLPTDEAKRRLSTFGKNTIANKKKSGAILLFLTQFKSPITLLLIFTAVLSFTLGDRTDTIIIMVIILISSLLGYFQERGAQNAVQELLKLVQLKCHVIRDGIEHEISVEDVVPGDLISFSAGDIIPADCLIISSQELYIDEAAFTGETYPVEKIPGVVEANAGISKRTNSLFMGSHVISGKGAAVAVSTGSATEFGAISQELASKQPETEFERGIRKFGYLLMEITLMLVIVIFAINVYLHKPVLESFLFSLALAVGLTPQLLPAIITINLSKGAKSMAGEKVIVKRLSSIENIGSMNILCSDKTGTITEGKVTLKDTVDLNGNHNDELLKYAWLNASMQKDFRNPIDEAISCAKCNSTEAYNFISEIPYDFIRKRLSILVDGPEGALLITKGAVNNVLEVCSFSGSLSDPLDIQNTREQIITQYKVLSEQGLRTLALAAKKMPGATDITKDQESGLVFLGFITLFDPPKKDARETIEQLNKLGVQLKVITGDNALVARSLALQMGFQNPVILTGKDLHEMSETALKFRLPKTHIFAEVEPNQKEKIITLLKSAGNVVGFMGDGINDAPALHAADVGISVDTAVDVAKEAADIVLLSNQLEVLIQGIISGRKTFANTMKYIFMATSANFGNMFSMAGASLFLPFLPLLPKQILLTNILTDLPEMTIATDSVDKESITQPKRWDIKFIQKFMVVFGLISSVFDYLTFFVLMWLFKAGEQSFQTGWFTESVISASLIVLVVRTRKPFLKSLPGKLLAGTTLLVVLAVLALPYTPVAGLFGFSAMPLNFYLANLGIVTAYIFSAEMAKKWFYKKVKY